MIDRTAVTVVDYGAGNLTSVAKGFRAVGFDVVFATDPAALDAATAIVIPGVGHFDATTPLDDAWRAGVLAAIDRHVPLLGICLGLQWFFDGSDEAPGIPGLGLFPGRCARLAGDVKVPHVGWNRMQQGPTFSASRLFAGVEPGEYTYFTHSYAAPVVGNTVAMTTHGVAFSAAVERGAVFGVQFHPEKSGTTGLKVLANFAAVVRSGQPVRSAR